MSRYTSQFQLNPWQFCRLHSAPTSRAWRNFMSTHTLKKVTAYVAIVTNLAAFTLPAAQAAPGIIANAPLNLTTTVEPNIWHID